MIFQNFFGNDQSRKKIVLFHNLPVVNAFLESEAEATGAGQNVIIEDALAERYLNKDKDISDSMVRNVTAPDYEQQVTFDVSARLAGMPEWANESILPLIEYMSDTQRHLDNHVSDSDTILNHFSKNSAWLAELLKDVASEDELRVLKDLGDYENISRVAETINSGVTLSLLLDYIMKYADVEVDRKARLINNTTPYRLICDICRLDTWLKRPGSRHRFTMLVKNVTLNK